MFQPMSRRAMLRGSVATAALFCARFPLAALAVDDPDPGVVLPFPEQTPTPTRPMIQWAQLSSWITPPEDFFAVSHYGNAKIDPESWRLEVAGLVRKPVRLSSPTSRRASPPK
jgi:DMSO/TMAO reductase YedYZ molybdopterin-dependent catalytic subunit